ncbi:MAG: DNA repair protein RecO [Candidatus Zambryskibacteria bacterium RIFCSPLOWO2_01_FULL_45_43]|uniref:DNA repair protein RecO n=1 Tax=Candidatus Zambryskibacteria bacterium RIFCSPLOWO2_01_FULL_45_43 TaxID=1802762 RepID=A0A1G2U704_9BACT|nr:MAG: DNA repair protein RecO [Candidatus Zambryskibacteria bacterium RIFCSPLOWO2_01_FULL_45_43]
MIEVISEAIVLDKEDLGEYDSRVFLYTKDFGKVAARATSLRKITSKMSSHLEPLGYVMARLVSSRDNLDGPMQLADALSVDYPKKELEIAGIRQALRVADCLSHSIPAGVPDKDLWDFLYAIAVGGEPATLLKALKFLGFDPQFSSCELCARTAPEYFSPKNNFFICRTCTLSSAAVRSDFIPVGAV